MLGPEDPLVLAIRALHREVHVNSDETYKAPVLDPQYQWDHVQWKNRHVIPGPGAISDVTGQLLPAAPLHDKLRFSARPELDEELRGAAHVFDLIARLFNSGLVNQGEYRQLRDVAWKYVDEKGATQYDKSKKKRAVNTNKKRKDVREWLAKHAKEIHVGLAHKVHAAALALLQTDVWNRVCLGVQVARPSPDNTTQWYDVTIVRDKQGPPVVRQEPCHWKPLTTERLGRLVVENPLANVTGGALSTRMGLRSPVAKDPRLGSSLVAHFGLRAEERCPPPIAMLGEPLAFEDQSDNNLLFSEEFVHSVRRGVRQWGMQLVNCAAAYHFRVELAALQLQKAIDNDHDDDHSAAAAQAAEAVRDAKRHADLVVEWINALTENLTPKKKKGKEAQDVVLELRHDKHEKDVPRYLTQLAAIATDLWSALPKKAAGAYETTHDATGFRYEADVRASGPSTVAEETHGGVNGGRMPFPVTLPLPSTLLWLFTQAQREARTRLKVPQAGASDVVAAYNARMERTRVFLDQFVERLSGVVETHYGDAIRAVWPACMPSRFKDVSELCSDIHEYNRERSSYDPLIHQGHTVRVVGSPFTTLQIRLVRVLVQHATPQPELSFVRRFMEDDDFKEDDSRAYMGNTSFKCVYGIRWHFPETNPTFNNVRLGRAAFHNSSDELDEAQLPETYFTELPECVWTTDYHATFVVSMEAYNGARVRDSHHSWASTVDHRLCLVRVYASGDIAHRQLDDTPSAQFRILALGPGPHNDVYMTQADVRATVRFSPHDNDTDRSTPGFRPASSWMLCSSSTSRLWPRAPPARQPEPTRVAWVRSPICGRLWIAYMKYKRTRR